MTGPPGTDACTATRVPNGRDAWLVSPDRRLAGELSELLAREAPGLRVAMLREYSIPDSAPPPLVCFLDACSNPQQAFGLLGRLPEPPLHIPVVALLSEYDHEVALRCLRGGACGCLIQPFDSEQLQPLLLRVGYLDQGPEAPASNKVLCVLPAKGSCGATTLAASLACQAARSGHKRILLADFDPVAGTLAFVLKLKSSYSFVDALTHAGRLDADLWRGLVTPYRGMDVLLSPESPLDCDTDADGLQNLLAYARRSYGLVVIDTGGPFGGLGLELAKSSDEVLLVLTPELASVYSAKRAAPHLAGHGVSKSKIRLVLSRWKRDLGFDREQIESAVGLPVLHALPNDPEAVEDALLEGRPIAPGTLFGKSLTELATRLLDYRPTAEKTSALKGFRSLFTRGI